MSWWRLRGAACVLNVLVIALLAWLVAPLFNRQSAEPVVFGRYSLQYALYLAVWVVLILMYAIVAGAAGRARNLPAQRTCRGRRACAGPSTNSASR